VNYRVKNRTERTHTDTNSNTTVLLSNGVRSVVVDAIRYGILFDAIRAAGDSNTCEEVNGGFGEGGDDLITAIVALDVLAFSGTCGTSITRRASLARTCVTSCTRLAS
jgi:hypothetical protein